MIIGAAYYPEHWDKNRWAQDAALMREMGLNTVRMGEFGWSVMEREEGCYDFSLYEEAIRLFAEYGISTILGTPTAAPPAWLCEKYPDIYMTDREGRKRGFGSRRHYCYNHRGYQEASRRIVSAMARHFKENPHIIAWQADNELGCEDEVRCYCEDCRLAFIGWLKEKYRSLEALNESWGTIFWSQTYTRWEQIVLPARTVVDGYTGYGHNPGLLLDFAGFSSDSLIRYAQMQCEWIRRFTDRPVVHNVVSEFCDNYKLSALFDRAGYDAYPRSEWDCNSPGRTGFHYDLTRGLKEAPFWILEQQSGPCGWNVLGKTPEDGQLKLWSLQGAARGAEALIYFRWRTCLFGTEQFWYGILDHDGIAGRRYREIGEAVCEIRKYEDIFSLPNHKQTLLLYDYDNKFCHEFQPHASGFIYKEEVTRFYEALLRLHLSVDVGSVHTQPDDYEMVILPFCSMLDTADFERLEKYVRRGGTLVLTPFTGQRLKNNRIVPQTLPGVWRKMAGIRVEEFYSLQEEQTETEELGNIRFWREKIALETAACAASCTVNGRREAVISENSWGKGSVFYLAALFEDCEAVLDRICRRKGVAGFLLPQEVECIAKEGKEYLILLNHSKEEKKVRLDGYRRAVDHQPVEAVPGMSWAAVQKRERLL